MTLARVARHPAANAPAPSGFVPPTNSLYLWANYNANNQVTGTAVNGAAGGFTYDLAGNVIYDEANKYIYDFDGRICAVWNTTASTMTQYVYDAGGRRVAKGTISSWPSQGATCAAPTTANGFNLTNVYLRGLQGNQDTELNGQGNWVHTNIYSDGGLTATFWNSASGSTPALSYNFSNWLGTKRMQATAEASPNPMLEEYTRSYPFGNLLSLSGNGGDATEQHFTGKERDAESGNDYFGARYYGSSMGRFMSPDSHAGTLGNPQTLNRYTYGLNNPLAFIDPTGNDCVYAGSSAATSTTVRGDCISDSDSGVFVDGHVDSITDNPGGSSATIHWGDHTDANNPYDNPLQTSMMNARAMSGDPWGGHAFAQQLFQGAGSGSFVAANTAVNYAAGGYALLAGGAVFAPEIAAGTGAAASWGANATGLLGPAANRIFWSGAGYFGAQAAAELEEGSTLESTFIGRVLENTQDAFGLSYQTMKPAWDWASSAFANGAQGTATMYQGLNGYTGQIWNNIESPILNSNSVRVTSVPF